MPSGIQDAGSDAGSSASGDHALGTTAEDDARNPHQGSDHFSELSVLDERNEKNVMRIGEVLKITLTDEADAGESSFQQHHGKVKRILEI